MGEAKVHIKVGEFEFSGEGDQEWVAKQLDKILAKADELISLTPPPASEEAKSEHHKPMGSDAGIAKKTLPAFLSEKGATKNQIKKFLATAIWLEAKGKARLSTGEISKAIKDANQSKLSNPSECLKQNISKGYCEKDGKEFFVTAEGKASL
ncbi:MAG: hypothetical protein HZA18_00915 [Nitrospirae bacterium]|nr:hypothetical protein [Nitrospirota bacterium]